MYYRLGADVAGMSQYWRPLNNEHVLTILGEVLDVENDAIDLPFRFEVNFTPGLDGGPARQPLYAFLPNVNAMHKRLVESIRGAGADNLQSFAAQVVDGATGEVVDDYEVVNVVGMVSCANLQKSRAHPIAGVYYFEELVIDPAATDGQLMFRLAESPMEIVVHGRVADAIRAESFEGVTLEPLSESPGA